MDDYRRFGDFGCLKRWRERELVGEFYFGGFDTIDGWAEHGVLVVELVRIDTYEYCMFFDKSMSEVRMVILTVIVTVFGDLG